MNKEMNMDDLKKHILSETGLDQYHKIKLNKMTVFKKESGELSVQIKGFYPNILIEPGIPDKYDELIESLDNRVLVFGNVFKYEGRVFIVIENEWKQDPNRNDEYLITAREFVNMEVLDTEINFYQYGEREPVIENLIPIGWLPVKVKYELGKYEKIGQ